MVNRDESISYRNRYSLIDKRIEGPSLRVRWRAKKIGSTGRVGLIKHIDEQRRVFGDVHISTSQTLALGPHTLPP